MLHGQHNSPMAALPLAKEAGLPPRRKRLGEEFDLVMRRDVGRCMRLLRRKPMRRGALEGLAGAQDDGREAWVIDRIRVVLRLQVEAGVLLVHCASHARQ